MTIRKEVIEILQLKNNEISLQIIEVIDIFSDQELLELKLILLQSDPWKLKEALLYKHSLFEKTVDKIINLQKEFHEIKEECIKTKLEKENDDLDKSLDEVLNKL